MKRACVLALAILLALLAAGCEPASEPQQIVWTPSTAFGQQMLDQYGPDFQGIISEVAADKKLANVKFAKDGIFVGKNDTAGPIFAFTLMAPTIYNTLQTTFPRRAASTFTRYLYPFTEVLATHLSLFQADQVNAFSITLNWKATNFLEDKYHVFAQWEGMCAVIPKGTLLEFAESKISIQELGRRSVFLTNNGRTELDFSNTI